MSLGCVVIGRNEGERLKRCLNSLIDSFDSVVYVDSASTDDSVEFAKTIGVDVVALDMSKPFTAARARNTGFNRLIELTPEVELVQFVDGDSSLEPGWVESAKSFLDTNHNVAAVAGHLKEVNADKSIYNWLCNIEWSSHEGEVASVGGNAMMRASYFQQQSGFNESLIAGEEPELCHRYRMKGYKIYHLNQPMGLHDAAITRFSQWWKRVSRGGFAFASVSWMYRNAEQKIWVRETLRPVFWGIILPLVFIFGLLTQMTSLIVLPPILILLLWVKITAKSLNTMSAIQSAKYGFFMVMAKFAEAMGVLKWLKDKMLQKRSTLIEYK